MSIKFYNNAYIRSHGKTPKGTGSWAFQISSINYQDRDGKVHWTPAMTLTAAKRWVAPYILSEAASYVSDATEIDVEILP